MDPIEVRAALQLAVGASAELVSVADRLCRACVAVLPVDGAALSITHHGSTQGTFGSSGELSRRLDELQFTFGEGPCLDSVRDGYPVLVPDLQDPAESRWPAYSEAVIDLGVRAVYALPVAVESRQGAALDLYARTPGHLSSADLAGALLAAELAGQPLFDLLAVEEHWARGGEGGAGPPAPVLLDRIEVYQATGMVMGQLDVGPTEALLRLRAYAFAAGLTATEVALLVLRRRLTFDSDGDVSPSGEAADGGMR